jgi:hypothetical protein
MQKSSSMIPNPTPIPEGGQSGWKISPIVRQRGILAALYLAACSASAFLFGGIRGGNVYMLPILAGLAGAIMLWIGALVHLGTAGLALWRKHHSDAIAYLAAAALYLVTPVAAQIACKEITRYTEIWSLQSVGLSALREEAASLVIANNAQYPDVVEPDTKHCSVISPKDISPAFKRLVPDNYTDLWVSPEGVFFITNGLASVRSGYMLTPVGSTLPPQKSPLGGGGGRFTVRKITEGVFYVSVSG